jgi:hypothetical protein
MVNPRKLLWLPSALLVGALGPAWMIAGGLVSCDSTAKFYLPDRQFQDLQVISAFPARIDNDRVVRVCGVPLDGEDALEPNGVEIMVNLMSTEIRSKKSCAYDSDLSVKEGEMIDLTRVTTNAQEPTVAASNFRLTLDCPPQAHVPGGGQACENAESMTAVAVRYAEVTKRCDEGDVNTRLNVAVVVDDSGSTSGLVDRNEPYYEEPDFDISYPDPISKTQESDPYDIRLMAASEFIDSLTLGHDRTIAYSFGEKNNIDVACSNGATCTGGNRNGLTCLFPQDCPGGDCDADASGDSNVFTTLPISGPGSREAKCFGAQSTNRKYIELGLAFMKNNGGGRAPLWQAMYKAYSFFQTSPSEGGGKASGPYGARAIVVLTDGPDTCTYSDDFNYVDLTPTGGGLPMCRTKCTESEYDFLKLRNLMWSGDNNGDGQAEYDRPRNQCADGDRRGEGCSNDVQCPGSYCTLVWPVQVHIVQFQSPAHLKADARLQEIACRTGGSYQFLNTEQFNKEKADEYAPMKLAMARVRNALSGSWRPAFKLSALAEQLPPGQMTALQGSVKLESGGFTSLKNVYSSETGNWRFGKSGSADQRLLLRRACKNSEDCGGSEACGTNHCNEAGLCEAMAAPDNMPCGDPADEANFVSKRCCNGTCQQGICATVCKK